MTIWFMDDGSNTKESFTLNTHSFLRQEQLYIVDFLKNNYKITATLVKDRNKFQIRINKSSYQKFINIIKPFIIPSMIYKIDNPRNDLSYNTTESPLLKAANTSALVR